MQRALAVVATLAALAAGAGAAPLCWDANHQPYPTGAGVTVAGGATETLTLGTNDSATSDPLMPAMHCEWRVCPENPDDVLAVQAQFAVLGPGGSLEVTVELGDDEAPQHHTLWEAGVATFQTSNATFDLGEDFTTATYSFNASDLALIAADPAAKFYSHGCVHLVARTGSVTTTGRMDANMGLLSAMLVASAGEDNRPVACPNMVCNDNWGQASGFSVTFEAQSGCKPGTIKVGDACQNCPAGQTSVGVDATACVACSAEGGVFCAGTGLPEQSCPPGTFSPAGAAPAACQACDPSTTSLYGETACRACGNNADCHEPSFGGLYKGAFKTTGYSDGFAAASKMSADGLTMVVSGPGVGAGAWIYTRASVSERFERTTMLEMLKDASLSAGLDIAAAWGSSLLATAVDVDMSPDGSLVCASVHYAGNVGYSNGTVLDDPIVAGVNAAYVFERPGAAWNTDFVTGALLEPTIEADHNLQRFGSKCLVAGSDRVLVPDQDYGETLDRLWATFGDDNNQVQSTRGAVFVFHKSGELWPQAQMLEWPGSTTPPVFPTLATQAGFPSFGVHLTVDNNGEYMIANAQYGSALAYKWDGTVYNNITSGTDGIDDVLTDTMQMGGSFRNRYFTNQQERELNILGATDVRGGQAHGVFALSGDGQYFVTRVTGFEYANATEAAVEKEVTVYKRTGDAWAKDATFSVSGLVTSLASINEDGSRIVLLLDGCTVDVPGPGAALPGNFECTTGFGSKVIFERTGSIWAEYATLSTDTAPASTELVPAVPTARQGATADLGSVVSVQHEVLESGTVSTMNRDSRFFWNALSAGQLEKVWTIGRRAVAARPVVYDFCPAGTSCAAGSGSATACPAGSFCTGGATAAQACADGSYCPARSANDDTNCTAGSFCATPATQVACADGKYCPEGSIAEQNCTAGSFCATPATQVACANGSYCPEGSTAEQNCTAGSFCATPATQVACADGKYCPEGSTSGDANCTVASFCATPATQVACAAGKYCPESSTSGDANCTAGSFCATPATQVACANGSYCPEGSAAEQDCPAGSFCVNVTTRADCTTSGAYCPAGSTAEQQCPAGSFCANASSSEQCPAGSECPAGSTAPSACGLRTFASSAGSASCTECGAEQVPNAASGAIACGECPDGTMANDDFTACDDGSPAAAASASTVAALALAVVAAVFAA